MQLYKNQLDPSINSVAGCIKASHQAESSHFMLPVLHLVHLKFDVSALYPWLFYGL